MPFLCSPACFIHMWFLVFCEDSGSFSQMAFSSLSRRYYRASVEEHLATTGSLFAPHFCFQTMWFENITPMLLAVWVLGKASLMWVYQLYCSNCSRKPGLLLAEFSVMRVLPWCGDHLFDKENPCWVPLSSQRGVAIPLHWHVRCRISPLLLPCGDD